MNKARTVWEATLRIGYIRPNIDINLDFPLAIAEIRQALAEHFRKSSLIRRYLDELPKGPGTNCPDSPLNELVRFVATQNGQIDFSNTELNIRFAREIMMPVFQFIREEMEGLAHRSNDNSYAEYLLFYEGVRLAEQIDLLWLAWNQRLMVPYNSLSDKEKDEQKKMLAKHLNLFDYTVFDIMDGQITNRETWAQAFPEIIKNIDTILRELARDIQDEDMILYDYLQALRQAYTCMEIDELETRWKEVDRQWIRFDQDNRCFPIHGMENGYEHPFCVSPEMRLVVRTGKYEEIISAMRFNLVSYVREEDLLEADDIAKTFQDKIRAIDIGVFSDAIYAGCNLVFRLSGQVVPNRQEILDLGGKIFIEEASIAEGMVLGQERLDKHCAPLDAITLKKLLSEEAGVTEIAGHELSHPVESSAIVDQSLGTTKNLLEEAKATIGGLMAAYRWRKHDIDFQKALITKVIARLLGMLHKTRISDQTLAPYVRENILLANGLFSTGLIKLGKEGLMVDLSEKNITDYFNQLGAILESIILAYRHRDRNWLINITRNEYCKISPQLQDLIDWINR